MIIIFMICILFYIYNLKVKQIINYKKYTQNNNFSQEIFPKSTIKPHPTE